MRKKEFNRFVKLYQEVEKELKENKDNINLDKVIEIYKPFIGDSIFDEEKELNEKIKDIAKAFINCYYEKESIDCNIESSEDRASLAKDISIAFLIIQTFFSLISFNSLGILFSGASLFSILYGIVKKIKGALLVNDYNDNLVCYEYFLHLLESAEIELYRQNNSNDLTNFEQLIDLEEKIYFKMNNDNIYLEVVDNNTNLPINIKLSRHK